MFCVALRIYNHGIRTALPAATAQHDSTNSNSTVSESPEPIEPIENLDSYDTGVLDTGVMESLRSSAHQLESESCHSDEKCPEKERTEKELQDARARGNIVLRLQFLNDSVRYVHAPPEMPVIFFKRKFFADELERQHKSVRLIFQGRELKALAAESRDSPSRRRLCDYGVTDNATIHCLISDAPPPSAAPQSAAPSSASVRPNFAAPDDIDLGTHAMMPLFAFMLTSVWLFRFTHAEYFSFISTLALVCLSVFFGGAAWSAATARRHRPSEVTSGASGDARRTS
ncbi:unnamed protein product [Mesocestoides corti]|nr:unnamed protein product [Mesocestoides corti]